jgi:outer membrane lipoprotein-sorting protein
MAVGTSLIARSAGFLVVALAVAGAPRAGAHSQDAARAAHERMLAAYKSIDALHVKAVWTARYSGGMSRDDFPLPGPEEIEVRMQRPNRIRLSASAKGGRPPRYLIVSDGTTLSYWRSGDNTFVQAPAPATFAEMPRVLPEYAIGTFDGTTWEADSILEWDLLSGDTEPITRLTETGLTATLGAREKIGDAIVDVLRLTTPPASPMMPLASEVTYYLDATTGLIRRYRMNTRGKHPDNGRDFAVTMEAAYTVHVTLPRFTDSDFAFTPPPGARRVEAKRKDRNSAD